MSKYPISNSDFYLRSGNTDYTIDTNQKCSETQGFSSTCTEDVKFGFHKPLNEVCKDINNDNNYYNENCNSIWNNMTKRKSLVKDY